MLVNSIALVPLALLAFITSGSSVNAVALSDKIKKVVVLLLENRSFDNLAGYYNYTSDIDNLIQYQHKTGAKFCNALDLAHPEKGTVCAEPNGPDALASADDPDHAVAKVMYQLFGKYYNASMYMPTYPPMNGFVADENINKATHTADYLHRFIDSVPRQLVPHTEALAKNFVLFDRWFASVPGPTNPNRAYATSGTSAGHGENDVAFFFAGLKQRSIFQHLHEKGITWKNYEASSASGFAPDSRFYSWTSGHLDRVVALSNFYTDAKSGALPQFSYLNPECCSQFSYHPPSPVSKGEAFVKQVYEAVRNGPDWNHTALIITFDEHGGFADHVPPPPAPKPGDGLPYNWKGGNGGASGIFEFDRYGVRVPTFLISPYVPAGLVQHGNDTGAQYDHTSILKFVETLWGLPALTNRDKNARDLVDLFTLSSPRGDCPTVI